MFSAGELFHFFDRAVLANELCGCGQQARDCDVWGEVIRELEGSGFRERAEEYARFTRRLIQGPLLPQFLLPWKSTRMRQRLQEYQEVLARLLMLTARVTGARAIVDSSKAAVFGRLLTLLPGVKVHVVHLVRDSRGVTHSWSARRRRRTGAPGKVQYLNWHPVSSGALLWTAAQLASEALGRRADGYTRIRYEDFVRDASGSLRELASAYEELPDSGRLNGGSLDLGDQHVLAGNSVRMEQGWVPVHEDGEWRDRMPVTSQRLVSSLTLPLLVRYGYIGNGRQSAVRS